MTSASQALPQVLEKIDADIDKSIERLFDLVRIPWFHPIQLMNANKAVIGVNLGHLWDRIDMLRAEMLALLEDCAAGRIKPVVGKTFPLDQAAAAHRYIHERQNVGKVVLTVA